MKYSDGTKLPPIQKKPTQKLDKNGSGGGAAQKMTRNASAAKSTAFGAKSIDLLKSLWRPSPLYFKVGSHSLIQLTTELISD